MVRVLLSSKEKFIIKTKNEAGSNAMDTVHSNNEVTFCGNHRGKEKCRRRLSQVITVCGRPRMMTMTIIRAILAAT